jgi:hypothetical protein
MDEAAADTAIHFIVGFSQLICNGQDCMSKQHTTRCVDLTCEIVSFILTLNEHLTR